MNIRQLMRTGHVKRWHIVRVGREQSIAEHMYRVWLICREMSVRMKLDSQCWYELEHVALRHDIPEVVMGDIPTPTKHYIEKRTNCLTDLEAEIDASMAEAISDTCEKFPIVKYLLKLADLTEAIHFLTEEGIGDHARSVEELLRKQYKTTLLFAKEECPEAAWSSLSPIYSELCD